MTFRALMVMKRKNPENEADTGAIAELFAEHDKGDLPALLGITRRTLFRFNDLYFHLLEADSDFLDRLMSARDREDFGYVNKRLDEYLDRYDPATWTKLTDSMATPFYDWLSTDRQP